MHSADAAAQAPARPGASAYLPALDGLRAVAIGLVVASHAGLGRVVPGAFGVTLFFFISGYLITRQLLHSLSAHGRIGLAGFYLRRALRLLPAGLVYIVAGGLAFMLAGGRISPAGWLAAVFYGANLYDIWIGYRSSLAQVRHPFNILWSLAIEEQFYAVWPLVLAAIWRWRGALAGLWLLCLAVLLWRARLFGVCGAAAPFALCGRVQADPAWLGNRLYLGTDTRIDSLAWGALLALAEARHGALFARAGRSGRVAAAGLVLLAASFLPAGAFARQVVRTSLQGAALLLLFPVALAPEGSVGRVLSRPAALLIGRLSYSLYLWHWGAFALADRVAGAHRPAWLMIGLPAMAGLAAASYSLIERPMLRLRRRAGSQALPEPGVRPQIRPAPLPEDVRHAAP
jgi:peptidoglycan/LPS O-acetylase OafA/YrhL